MYSKAFRPKPQCSSTIWTWTGGSKIRLAPDSSSSFFSIHAAISSRLEKRRIVPTDNEYLSLRNWLARLIAPIESPPR